jgi:hypothetical protein
MSTAPLDPNTNLSLLLTMQQQATDRLLGDKFFEDIPVVNESRKDIESDIQMALSKIGLCVLVLTPEANVNNQQDVPYPYFDKIMLVCQVVEHPTINRSSAGTGKFAATVAEHVAILIHAFKPAIGNEFYLDNPSITLVPDENFLVYQVRFGCAGGIKPLALDDRQSPPVPPTPVTVSGSYTDPDLFFTFTSTLAHGFISGQTVTISGAVANPSFNGTYIVTVLSSTTFSVVTTNHGSAFAETGLTATLA